jgi:predicted ArsR family transcriptional regulator
MHGMNNPKIAARYRDTAQPLLSDNLTVRQIAEARGIAPVNFSLVRQRLVRLQEEGYVREVGKTPPVGKRKGATIYALTDAGRALVKGSAE